MFTNELKELLNNKNEYLIDEKRKLYSNILIYDNLLNIILKIKKDNMFTTFSKVNLFNLDLLIDDCDFEQFIVLKYLEYLENENYLKIANKNIYRLERMFKSFDKIEESRLNYYNYLINSMNESIKTGKLKSVEIYQTRFDKDNIIKQMKKTEKNYQIKSKIKK